MKEYSRNSIPTDQSLEMQSTVSKMTFNQSAALQSKALTYYIDKIESHISLMETEFQRNIQWQKVLLKELRSQKNRSKSKQEFQKSGLKLSSEEQKNLKHILKLQLNLDDERYDLKELIKMIGNKKKKPINFQMNMGKENRRWSEEVDFPIIPRVITLNDLAPSTQKNLHSSKLSHINHTQTKMNISNYNHITKDAKRLFSPESQEILGSTPKLNSEQSIKYQEYAQKMKNCEVSLMNLNTQNQKIYILQDSLGKRLIIQSQNQIKFQQYINNDQKKLRQSQNISFCLSKSHQGKRSGANQEERLQLSDRASILLSSHQDSSTPLRKQMFQLQKERQCKDMFQEQQFLCFSGAKRRRISQNIEKDNKKMDYRQITENRNMKKMNDSFGRSYEYICEMPNAYQLKLDDLKEISKQYKHICQSFQSSFK